MIALTETPAKVGAFFIGVALHLFVFRTGEWDLATTKIIVSSATIQAASVLGLVYFGPLEYNPPFFAVKTVSTLSGCLLTGLTISILVYRGLFHRLGRFPGPYLARFSNLYATSLSAKRLHLYEEVQSLHQQYGDYVRLGPSELSVNDPKAVSAILSNSSPCVKGPWYGVLHPLVSLQMVRTKKEHIPRRKVWDRAFNAKALRDYEPRVTSYTTQLLSHLSTTANKPVNVTDWFNFYSFDVMGDLAWGKSFNMLRDGTKHYFMKSLHADMTNIGLFSHLVWLFPLFKATPGLNYEHIRFQNWTKAQVAERRANKPNVPDVFSWILEDYEAKVNPTAQDELNLLGDALLIAVAGSDTTAATLTCLFFQLALSPSSLSTLQKEVDALFESSDPVDATSLSKLPYLDAVINEALRLHPPVPSGMQRMTPPEGLRIGDVMVPGDSIVQIPLHTLFRDERVFVDPDEFVPERWTTKKDMVIDAGCFVPFSLGRSSCVGKQLGLMEVRYVTAQIVRRYNVKLAPGQTPKAFLDGKRDTFTLALSELNLVFEPRN
ncbi:averantin oxidoreductase [Acephala macrosclerotiorum]|nr:averantin oxidoreductase [Acephala macrosclerotiorum]